MTSNELRRICIDHAIAVSLAGFIREADVARLLDVDIRTLQNWRRDLRGPECVRMGGTWRYSIEALAKFMTPVEGSRKHRKGAESSAGDDHLLARDHAAGQPRRVES
jgi:hypothetical protein